MKCAYCGKKKAGMRFRAASGEVIRVCSQVCKKKYKSTVRRATKVLRGPDPRMSLSISDMPRYPGENKYLVGEMRDHYPDGTHRPRWQKDGTNAS